MLKLHSGKKFVTLHIMRPFKILLLFILVGVQLPIMAQFHPMLDNFSAFEYEGNVYLSWTISRGSSCNGIDIERSDNNVHFNVIGDIPGVCGSADFAQSFDWIDRSPLPNTTNYYRLELGLNGHSESVSIEVISLNGKYQVRSNPMRDNGQIYFVNSGRREHTLQVYDISGKPVMQMNTLDNFFEPELSRLQTGLYLFTILAKDGSAAITGKFSVAR
jgi:hypothetical protein